MKKIFAIALALVMVLSMASAFAAPSMPGTCDWGTWDCTTYTSNCGVAKAEVVKFVRTNDCDPFVESDCAAVVKGEKVYFGVKVIFDENVNEQWYNHDDTNLDITFSKLVNGDGSTVAVADRLNQEINVPGKTAKQVSGKTFWYDFVSNTLVEEFSDACVGFGYAASTGVKVCANVDYDFNGKGVAVDFGKYTVEYVTDATSDYLKVIDKATNDVAYFDIGSGSLKGIEVAGNKIYNAYANGKFYGIKYTGTTEAEIIVDGEACSYLPAMMQFLKLEFGSCVTAEGVQNFLGWIDDEAFKACATWSKNASSIVDAECVVAIPKTGDASVLAWLF